MAIADISADSFQLILLFFLYIGFGIKVGALPFHGWMPLAYQVTPLPAAAALAGAMVNAEGGIDLVLDGMNTLALENVTDMKYTVQQSDVQE